MITPPHDNSIIGNAVSWPSAVMDSTACINLSASAYHAATRAYTRKVDIDDSGIVMAEGTDIIIGGQSLAEFMRILSDRLSILHPDPAKLERYTALRDLYDQYRMMEKLLIDDNNHK